MIRSILRICGLVAVAAWQPAFAADPDLSETTEIQFGSDAECAASSVSLDECALRAKAIELGSAVQIYEHVRNEHEYTLYQGSRSNSTNSFLGKRANDVDMASVLIAMLRSRGIPARYAVGTVRIESSKITNWLNVQNLDLAVAILRDQGVQKVVLSADRQTVDLEHVWAEALVSYSNYRGAGPDAASVNCATQRSLCHWIGLAPAFKLHQPDSSAIDVYPTLNFDYTRYFNAIKNKDTAYKDKNPLEIYQEQILEHLRAIYPGKPLDAVSNLVSIQQEKLNILPNSLPFQAIGSVRRYNSIAEHDAVAPPSGTVETKLWTKYVRIRASLQGVDANGNAAPSSVVLFNSNGTILNGPLKIQNGLVSAPLAALSTTQLTLAFKLCPPENDCAFSAELRAGGSSLSFQYKTTNQVVLGARFYIELELDGAPGATPGVSDHMITANYTNNVIGGYYLIGTGGDTSNWSQVHRASADLLAANDQYPILNNASSVPYVDTNANGVIDGGEPRLLDHPSALDALTGGLLHTAMNLYYARFTDAIRQLDALNHVVSPIEGFVGVVSTTDVVEYVDGTAFSVMPGGLLIDMKGQSFNGNWRTDAAATYANKHFELLGHVMSSLEHEIWQEITGYDAISTVRGLQFALANGAALLNPKKNSTEDTVPASYAGFGFTNTAPSPFILRERDIFTTRQASWEAAASPVNAFRIFKASVSPTTTPLRLSGLIYASNNGVDGFLANYDNAENEFKAHPNSVYPSVTICGVTYTNKTGSYLLPYLESCYFSVVNNPSNDTFFDYYDENNGFVPTENVYRSTTIASDQYSDQFVFSLRNNIYLIACTDANQAPLPCWREYTIAGKLSVGPNFKFAVYVDKVYESAGNKLFSQSFIIQNQSFTGGGGYVEGQEALEQHADTTGTVFNNEVFTDQNLNALVNNDLIKTPSTADPVSTVTGNMYHDETDIVIKGRGLNYSFTRSFNSGPTSTKTNDGPLGPGWTHSYAMRLVANDYGRFPNYPLSLAPENANGKTSSVTYVDERGGEVNYLVNDLDNSYAVTAPKGVFDNLVLDSPVIGQHTLTFRNGVQYIFQGVDLKTPGNIARLFRIQDPYGNQLNFAYNFNGTLASITDQLAVVTDNLGISGRTGLSFSYEFSSGRLSSVSDWTGRTWSYTYDNGRLASVKNPKNEITTYTYHLDTPLLMAITWPQDRGGQKVVTTFRYYRNNKTFDYTNALGQVETLDYDLYRKRTRVTDPRGFVREHYYDEDGAQTKLTEPDGAALLFDNNDDGLRFSKIDGLGYKTLYSYRADRAFNYLASNTFGKITKEQDPLLKTVLYDYDLFDQIKQVTDKNLKVWQRVYYQTTNTAAGAIRGKLQKTFSPLSTTVPMQEYTYYANGNVKQQIEYIDLANTAKKRITDYTFDTAGLNLLEQKVTGSGQTVRMNYTYDGLARKKTETLHRRKSATDATLLQLTSTYDYDALDRVIKVTDPLGNIAETVYDANDRVTEEKVHYKRPDATFDTRVYARHEYDLADRRVKTTDIDGLFTTFSYDASSNLIASTDANGHTTRYEYDAMNRRVAVIAANGYRTEMVYDLAGRLIKTIDANGNAARMEYDALGRNTKAVTPLGNEAQLVYDANGNLTKATDANALAGVQPKNTFGASVYNEYDSANRLTRTVDAANGETLYTYDLLGNTLTIKDAELRTTTLVYNDLGRLIQVKDPLIETPTDKIGSLTYDEAGNLLTLTDRKGQVSRYTYDTLNRLTLTEYLSDATNETRVYTLYGNLESVSNAAVSYAYQYDSKNRLTRKTDTRLNKFLAWTYDPAGMIRTKTDYQSEVTTYQYDSSNRLVAQTNPGYVQVSYHYDPAGRLLDRILSNGAMTQYGYDADNRLTKLINKSANGTVVQSQTYAHDRLRNITSITDSSGAATTYAYDPLYRLLNANAPGTAFDQTYTYDKVGNRKTLVTAAGAKAYVYNAGNRLTELRNTSATGPIVYTYVYDDNGSRIQKKNASGAVIQSYTYDQKRRISQLIAGSTTDSFQYDPADYRIQKLDSQGTQKYLLEAEHLEATYDQNNQLLDKYLRGAVVDEIVYGYRKEGSRSVPATYHHDHLQSLTALTGHEGSTQETIKYDPFGNIQSSTGSSGNDLNYTGRERDRDTGLYYYRARYYDPEVGRFLSEDPLGFRAGINFYAYVGNNPVNGRDPTGLDSVTVNLGLIGVEVGRDENVPSTGFWEVDFGLVGLGFEYDPNASVPTMPGFSVPSACTFCTVTSSEWQTGSSGLGLTLGPVNWNPISYDQPTVVNQFFQGNYTSTFVIPETQGQGVNLGNVTFGWSESGDTGIGLGINLGGSFSTGGTFEFWNSEMPGPGNSVSPSIPTLDIFNITTDSLFGGAGGGYVLYPGRSNANMMSVVYSKGG